MREISLDELSEYVTIYINDNDEIILKVKSHLGIESTHNITIQTTENIVLNSGDKIFMNSSPASIGLMDIDEIVRMSQEAYEQSLNHVLESHFGECNCDDNEKGA